MKKSYKLLISLIFLVILLFAGNVYALDNIPVYFNGELMNFDVPAMTIDGRTMVPMRAIFEKFGMSVYWDGDTQSITALKSIAEGQHNTIKMQIDNNIMTKNGESIELDVPPMVIDGRTLVPVRAIAEALDANVVWSNNLQAVGISTDGIDLCEEFPMFPDFSKAYDMKIEAKEIDGNNGKYYVTFEEGTAFSDKFKNFITKNNYVVLDYSRGIQGVVSSDRKYIATFVFPNGYYIIDEAVEVRDWYDMYTYYPQFMINDAVVEGWNIKANMPNGMVKGDFRYGSWGDSSERIEGLEPFGSGEWLDFDDTTEESLGYVNVKLLFFNTLAFYVFEDNILVGGLYLIDPSNILEGYSGYEFDFKYIEGYLAGEGGKLLESEKIWGMRSVWEMDNTLIIHEIKTENNEVSHVLYYFEKE